MPVNEIYSFKKGFGEKMLIDVIVMINSLLVYIHNIGFELIKDTLINR